MSAARRAGVAAVIAAALVAAPAGAQTPTANIQSGGPLKNVWVGNELSCQVAHVSDAAYQVFPSGTIPGDCGTIVADATNLYAPNFAAHGTTSTGSLGARTAWTPVSQSAVTGAGTTASPFTVTTVATGGPFRVTQVDTYVAGQEAYRTDVALENTGATQATGVLYRAGDCYLQGNDNGFGFVDGTAAGCSSNANNQPAGRIEQWFPITGGNQYIEAFFRDVWSAIATRNPFPNTALTTQAVDNGAGISWSFALAPGATQRFAHFTVFSPTGAAGAPAPVPAPTPAPAPTPTGPVGSTPPAFGPGGVVAGLPSPRKCVSRRAFRIRVRQQRGRRYSSVQVFVNGRQVAVRRGSRVTSFIDLRGLPKGRYTVRIIVITTTGEVIRGTRKYRTCVPKRRGPRL